MKRNHFVKISLMTVATSLIQPLTAKANDISGMLQQNVANSVMAPITDQAKNSVYKNKPQNGNQQTTQPTAADLSAQSQKVQSGEKAAEVNAVANSAKTQASQQSTAASSNTQMSLGTAMSSSETAGQASNEQSEGAGNNAMMSGIMGAMGAAFTVEAATCGMPPCQVAPAAMAAFSFLQAALGAMQSGNQGDTSGANNTAGRDFQTFGPNGGSSAGSTTTGANTGGTNGKGLNSGDSMNPNAPDYGDDPYKNLPTAARDAISKMTSLGYAVDLKNRTFTTPDGHSISAKDANNGALVESKLGLPEGTYAKGMDMMSEALKKSGINTDAGSFVSSAGSGDGGYEGDGSGLAQGEGYDGSGGKAGHKGKYDSKGGLDRAPASALVAGLTSTYNGERIGVAADDIFKMVTRRYQLKNEQDSFITLDRPSKGVLGDHPRK